MSRIKTMLFDPLQEQAEELGYTSVEEAIADGWRRIEIRSMGGLV